MNRSPSQASIEEYVQSISETGSVTIFPSDTVYGFAARAVDQDAVVAMYAVKQRSGKPGTILASSTDQLVRLGFEKSDITQASSYWPGPISVVLPAPQSLAYLHMGLESLAVRIPATEWLRVMLDQTGPLATTSANMTGEPTVTSIVQAQELFGDAIQYYLDGGVIENEKPSTILLLQADGTFKTLRP